MNAIGILSVLTLALTFVGKVSAYIDLLFSYN